MSDSQYPIPISGSLTVNAGSNLNTALLALDSTLTNSTQKTKITDGTDTLLVNTDGSISIVPVPIGTQANAWSAASVSQNGNSSVVDCQFVRTITIFGNVSANVNPLLVQASQDNSNFYTVASLSATTGNFGATFDFGARYMRLQSGQNGAARTITATITGK